MPGLVFELASYLSASAASGRHHPLLVLALRWTRKKRRSLHGKLDIPTFVDECRRTARSRLKERKKKCR